MAPQRSARALPDRAPTGQYGATAETTLVMPAVRRRRRWLRALVVALVLLLLAVGGVGFAAYEDPPLLAPLGTTLLGTQPGTVPWNGADPLNILVMGIDQRTRELTRSDSMIVLHVDPASHDVTMLSIPRDLWVSMPSPNPSNPYGYYKINAAYALGASYGQGPQFAQLAVESALGIPLNYYAVLKFSGFKSVVDAMGGVTVCVPRELYDPNYPDDVGYGAHTIDIKAGCQKMDGTTALVYARERHADAEQDLGRIQQQQVLLAGVEKQLLSSGTLLRSPAILSAVDGAVITDLPHGALPELGVLLGHARGAHTRHAYLNVDGGYVTDTTATDGQNILAGNWPRINALVAHLFADPPLRSAHASVQVRNGQHTPGLAALYTTILQGAGFTTVAPRNADRDTYARNLVIVNVDRPGADYTARKLTQMLQADVSARHLGPDHAQIIVILGADAAEGT